MRIFLVLSAAPVSDGEAVEVVAYEVIQQARKLGHSFVVQLILRHPRGGDYSIRAEQALVKIRASDCEVPLPLYLDDIVDEVPQTPVGVWERCTKIAKSFTVDRMFPASRFTSEVEARVRASRADVILGVWSWESLAATYRIRCVPKFMYYGNPDHLPTEARLWNPQLFGIASSTLRGKLGLYLDRIRNWRRKLIHVRMMNQCEVTANNSALDAQFYSRNGHPRSIYLQNMWPEAENDNNCCALDVPRDDTIKVIGSVGNLGATGNTFGLQYLGKELMPCLEKRLGTRRLEVHILGGGAPSAAVEQYLNNPRVIRRGWVDDINNEIRSSHAFLVLTNVSDDFLVGNTRILLAWALRACVVMHANSGLAMPEIRHGTNALLGRTSEEIADLIVQVAQDDDLRRRIGEGGYETFMVCYRSNVVVPKMMALLDDVVEKKDKRRNVTAVAAGVRS